MPKITVPQDLSNIKDATQFYRYASILFSSVVGLINGNLIFQDNMRVSIINCSFIAANTETSFSHSLGKTPQYYIELNKSAALTVYDGETANTDATIFLKSSATGTVNLMVF